MGIEYIDKTHAKLVVTKGSGSNRERKVKRITYTSKKDAKRQFDEFEKSISFTVDYKMTVNVLLDWYIGRFESAGGKETTVIGYKVASKAIKSAIGKRKACEVTLSDIDSFVRHQGKKYSPKSIKNQISLLNSSYKDAIRHGILDKNPCEYSVTPRQVKPSVEILSDSDISIFLHALDSEELDFKVMCELALFCGLRRSEIMGLLKSDVGELVTVSKVRHRLNGKDIIDTPKTFSSNRTISVPKFIQEDVKMLIQQQEQRPFKSKYLILNGFGEPVSPDWITRRMNKLTKSNNLPHVTMHGLRHTCASMLISNGVPIAEVSAHLGHSSIDITLKTYTHLFSDASTASRRISDLMDVIVAPNGHQNK